MQEQVPVLLEEVGILPWFWVSCRSKCIFSLQDLWILAWFWVIFRSKCRFSLQELWIPNCGSGSPAKEVQVLPTGFVDCDLAQKLL